MPSALASALADDRAAFAISDFGGVVHVEICIIVADHDPREKNLGEDTYA